MHVASRPGSYARLATGLLVVTLLLGGAWSGAQPGRSGALVTIVRQDVRTSPLLPSAISSNCEAIPGPSPSSHSEICLVEPGLPACEEGPPTEKCARDAAQEAEVPIMWMPVDNRYEFPRGFDASYFLRDAYGHLLPASRRSDASQIVKAGNLEIFLVSGDPYRLRYLDRVGTFRRGGLKVVERSGWPGFPYSSWIVTFDWHRGGHGYQLH